MISVEITTPVTIAQVEAALVKTYRRGLRNICLAAMGEWQDTAGRHLHKTRAQYQKAVQIKKVDDDTYEIFLHHPDEKTNWLVTAIEAGVGKVDLKPGLLGSESATRWSQFHKTTPGGAKVGGPFLDVPFRTGPAMSQAKPDRWRRVHAKSTGWIHPGFRPVGGGGLAEPLREEVKRYIKKTAQDVFGPLIRVMTV